MKSVDFVSNVNGLKVSVPGDAMPAPHCDGTMRPTPEHEGCMLQPSWNQSPVVFSFIAGSSEGSTGFQLVGIGTLVGAEPDDLVSLAVVRNNSGFLGLTLELDDTALGSVNMTVGGPSGVIVTAAPLTLSAGEWYTSVASPAMVAGETYCVAINFTPFEEE